MRPSLRATAFWGIVLGYATVAHACREYSGPPDSVSALPGLAFFRPDLVLLYPVLSGTLERPVYSLAGYRTATWGFSIQANLLASIAAAVFGFFTYALFQYSPLFLFTFVGAPVLAFVVKLLWFGRVPRDDASRPRIGWFALATLLSTLIIATLPLWMFLLGTSTQSWALKTQNWKILAVVGCLVVTPIVHFVLFSTLKRDALAEQRRGFEVLTPVVAMPLAIPAEPDESAPQGAIPI